VSGPELHFLGHSTVRVELAGRTVLTDPLLTGRLGPLRRVVATPDPAMWDGVDVVLISHLHGDHLHLPSLRLLGAGTRIVVPRGAGRWLRRRGFTRVDELAPGESLADGGLRITAVPARHSGHRWGPRLTSGLNCAAVGHLFELGIDPLAAYGPHAAQLVARTASFPHCPDVLINSRYDPETDEASPFEPHVGSHGGLGGPQQRGFLVHPRSFAPPGEVVGAEELHRVFRNWLTDLGHPLPAALRELVEPIGGSGR